MKLARIMTAAAVLTIAVATQVNAGKPKGPPPVMGPAPAALVANRQASMVLVAAATGNAKAALERGAPAKSQVFALKGVAKWADHLPSQFAPNTQGVPGTRAKSEIWSNRQEFLNKSTDMALAASAALRAAEADDRDGLTSALASVSAACKACHDSFQAPPPAKPAG